MALYSQVANLPVLFQIETGSIHKIAKYLKDKNLRFRRVLIVSGASFSANVAKSMLDGPKASKWQHLVIESNSTDEADRLQAYVFQNAIDLLVAVGGGKVLDVAKRVSLLQRVNQLAVPTIISNDGIASPISVLRKSDGKTTSLAAQTPIGVIVDVDIVRNAPRKYWQAAAGDILSNASSSNDWMLARDQLGEPVDDTALEMSILAVNSLLNYGEASLELDRYVRQIVHSLFCSGVAMGITGSSRPCSGSEHMISHAIDYLGLSPDTLHGIQVGSATLFTLHLQRQLRPEAIAFAKSWNIPLLFSQLSPDVERELEQIFDIARDMRPGRYTVLDRFSPDQLMQEYRGFSSTVV